MVWPTECSLQVMSMLKSCIDYLKSSRIPYSRAAVSADRVPMHSLAQAVVYAGDQGFGMLVLSADMVVDLPEVRRLMGLRSITPATEEELAGLFPGCATSALPPFGNLFGMTVLMDETLATAEYIAFSAGSVQDVIRIRGEDFHRLVNPLVASFAIYSSGISKNNSSLPVAASTNPLR